MTTTASQLSQSLGTEVAREFSEALERIEHCLRQLDEMQVWWRPDEQLNSIANLLLHLGGNVRQWIVAGIGGAEDVRERPDEFSSRGPQAKQSLFQRLQDTVSEAQAALCQVTPEDLLRVRRIQEFDVTGIQAIIECVAHFRGHTQEIVHMTRRQLGDAYEFAFVPKTPEQGA